MSGRRKTMPTRLLESVETFYPVTAVESMPSTSTASGVQAVKDALLLTESTTSIKAASKRLTLDEIVKQEEIAKEQNMMEFTSTSSPRGQVDSSKSDASSVSEHTRFVLSLINFTKRLGYPEIILVKKAEY
uniref:Uncharacterized protein n=1 Tax=Setaria digitata TaxID=48799 RepID=A0A915PCR0_9BILA